VVPALATYYSRRNRLLKSYAIGACGYVLGLLLSVMADMPSGATIVCAISALALPFMFVTSNASS
jgi:zinc/manganese transport system permease protein